MATKSPNKAQTIPKPAQRPKYVVVQMKTGRKRHKIPSDIPLEKIKLYEKYLQAKYDWEQLDRTFKSENGKEYSLPAVNKNLIIKVLPKNEQEAFKEKDKLIRSATGKVNAARNKVYPPQSKQEQRALFDEYANEVLDKLGKGWSAAEVHKSLLERSIEVPYRTILDYHARNREKVTELRNQFNEETQDVPLTNKRSRLERLNYLYHEISTDFDKTSTPLLRSNLSKELRGIIEQARKEVEGEELKLTVEGNIDVNATITAALGSSKLMYGLTIPQMVLSRVAARLGLPSQFLIDRLAYSFYAKYNGFRSNDDLKTKPIYPTSVQYDILDDAMQKKNAEWAKQQEAYQDQIKDVEFTKLVEEEKEEIKRRLRQKLGIKN